VKLNIEGHQASSLAPFSILKRIVMGETSWSEASELVDEGTFSILKRIVMGETYNTAVRWNTVGYFQYPQADRDG